MIWFSPSDSKAEYTIFKSETDTERISESFCVLCCSRFKLNCWCVACLAADWTSIEICGSIWVVCCGWFGWSGALKCRSDGRENEMENYTGAVYYNDNLEWLDFLMSRSSSIIDRQTRTCVLLDKRAREFLINVNRQRVIPPNWPPSFMLSMHSHNIETDKRERLWWSQPSCTLWTLSDCLNTLFSSKYRGE